MFVKFTDVPGRRAFLSPNVKMGTIKVIKMDLHGYHPSEIVQTDVLKKIIQQTWEMGENYVTLIHGHGRNRGISPGFVNTNTGYFGLEIRRALRHDKELRQWIRYTTLDCSHMGVTRVKLKPNPAPTRSELDYELLPEKKGGRQSWLFMPRRFSALSADRCEQASNRRAEHSAFEPTRASIRCSPCRTLKTP